MKDILIVCCIISGSRRFHFHAARHVLYIIMSLIRWMPYIRTEDIDTYYETTGSGTPIVLLHGGFVDHKMWQPRVDYFSEGYCVITYYLRGHGKTDGSSLKKCSVELFYADLAVIGHAAVRTVAASWSLLIGKSLSIKLEISSINDIVLPMTSQADEASFFKALMNSCFELTGYLISCDFKTFNKFAFTRSFSLKCTGCSAVYGDCGALWPGVPPYMLN